MATMADALGFAIHGLSPFRESPQGYFPRVFAFPGEEINWIGNVSVNDRDGAKIFFRRGAHEHITTDVYLGISPYRLVFFRKWFSHQQCRSLWFKLETEGWLWEPRKLFKKRRYRDIYLEIDRKKVFFGPKLDVCYKGVSTEGRVDNIEGIHQIYSIRGFDPASGKYEKNLADRMIAEIYSVYEGKKQPVSLSALKILRYEPQKLPEAKLQGKASPPPGSKRHKKPKKAGPSSRKTRSALTQYDKIPHCQKAVLTVHTPQMPELKEEGDTFSGSLWQKTLDTGDRLLFDNILVAVTVVEPEGPVKITNDTNVRIYSSQEPVILNCPHCGTIQEEIRETCANCSNELPVKILK